MIDLLGGVDAELRLANEVVEEVHGSDFREPRNGRDVYVGSGIRFFFQPNTVICPMPMISVELAALGHVSLCWVRLHLRWPS